MKGTSMIVMRRSFMFSIVRAAMTAGTEQPKPISIGITGFAGESEFPQQPVHDKSDARHISAVLQKRKKTKQNCDLRQKGQNAAHTADDAVHKEALDPYGRIRSFKQARNER